MAASLERLRMSYDEYQALPESVRAEWVDGEVVVSPAASFNHQRVSRRLANLIEAGLPDVIVVEAVSVHLPNNRERIPDIVVVERAPETRYVDVAPVLVVEILSPSTASEDTVRKSTEYVAAGIGQYWIVDIDRGIIDVFENRDGGWEVLARVDEHAPTAEVAVAPYGAVELSLGEVLDG